MLLLLTRHQINQQQDHRSQRFDKKPSFSYEHSIVEMNTGYYIIQLII